MNRDQIETGGPAFPMQEPQAIHAYAVAAVEGITDPDERDRAYLKARGEAVGGMKERPVLFSAPMVRAILEGRKTQTRRPYKNRKHPDFGCAMAASELVCEPQHVIDRTCPYGQPGDLLWVKETTIKVEDHGYVGPCFVESDEGRAVLEYGLSPAPDDVTEVEPEDIRKRPAIHMPRAMSRILLEVTAVRVERLQDISEADAIAEGILEQRSQTDAGWVDYWPSEDGEPFARASEAYRALWESINGPSSWTANPWVWVITFRRIEQ